MNHHPLRLIAFAATLLGLLVLPGCGGDETQAPAAEQGGILVTTPLLGEAANTLLQGTGVDVHTVAAGESTPEEIRLVIFHGLGYEPGPAAALEDLEGAISAGEFVPESQRIQTADGWDPHVWMDVSLWGEFVVQGLADQFVEMYPTHADQIRENSASYLRELARIDAYGREAMKVVPEGQRTVPSNVEGLAYFARAYGLTMSEQAEPIDVELLIDAPGPAGTYEGTYVGMMDHNITFLARDRGAPGINVHGALGRLTLGHDHDHDEAEAEHAEEEDHGDHDH